MIKFKKYIVVLMVSVLGLFYLSACSSNDKSGVTGRITIDGSSTVFPITEAVAEEFRIERPDVHINIGFSGTGGGFKKFISGEIDINNASRTIKESEKNDAINNGIEFEEFEVAYDGVVVVVNKDNDFVDNLTIEELNNIWKHGSKIMKWSDIRREWPNEPIVLYAPGTDSGTFDYFTEAVNGETGNVRTDFTPSEDDNVLVQGVIGSKNALSFFGYAYYLENKDDLKAVPIDNGNGAIMPTEETIKSGQYAPLSRPLYIYVNREALAREYVNDFINFYLSDGSSVTSEVGYVELSKFEYEQQLQKLK